MLTKDQIDHLYQFCEKHLVYYYELQTELVDHLANGIEAEMKADETLSFTTALEKVYSGFGVMGFSTFVKEKQIQVFKNIRRELLRLSLRQFRWPSVLNFILVFSLIYTVTLWYKMAGICLMSALVIGASIYEFYRFRQSVKFFKTIGRKFLLRTNYFPIGIGWIYFLFYFMVNTGLTISSFIWNHPVYLALFTSISIITILASVDLNRQITDRLIKDYPEVFQLSA